MYPDGKTEQIDGVAGEINILSGEIIEENRCIYYKYTTSSGGYIKESCLSLVQEDLKESFTDSVVEIYTYPLDCLYKEGDLISCNIHDTFISEGKIHFENGNIYICQNECDGNRCDNTLGYDYSWIIYDKRR